ncbi:ferritin-like domain-containing protein [Proteocatella sphenisci]|uniref:ferritin-like domain-containing protein n=1 Tax=Proteocatella sphenisci TaxID=181070 RepID=UPI0004B3BF60|nr:DUF2202 domain-containing protein [Proteocatella sphenisci]
MRKNILKKSAGIFLSAAMIVSAVSGGAVYAVEDSSISTEKYGAAAASSDSSYTLEEMLVYAVEDENLALAGYQMIIEKFGAQRPFTNIVRAEQRHVSMLLPLFEKYKVTVPEKDWKSLVEMPPSLQESYGIEIKAEENNIAMYEKFLKEDLNDDVRAIFERLMNASKNHLRAFENAASGTCTGTGNGTGMGQGRRNGNGNGQGRRQAL